MAKISDGYTIGAVVKCIREVINCKRMLQLRVQPLTHVELINSLRWVSLCVILLPFLHRRVALASVSYSSVFE